MLLRPLRWVRCNHPDASRGDRGLALRPEPIATFETVQHGHCARHRCAGSGELPHAGTRACWRQNRPGCSSAGHGHTRGKAALAGRSEHTSATARRLARVRSLQGQPTLRSMRSCCPLSTSASKRDPHNINASKSSPPDGSGARRRKLCLAREPQRMHVVGCVKGSLRRATPALDAANHVKCSSAPKPPPRQRIVSVPDERSHASASKPSTPAQSD